MSEGSFSFEKQKFISDFYGQYEDTQTFETALINLMLETDAAHIDIADDVKANAMSKFNQL